MSTSRKPHLLFFNPDQWRGDALGHLGNEAVKTPVLDAFVAEGAVSFRHAFCQNPVCTPSRCSFMSGWYPHVRGHRTMHRMLHPECGEVNLLKTLKDNGYFIFWAGKNDLVPRQDGLEAHCDVYFEPTDEDFARWKLQKRKNIHDSGDAWRGPPGSDTYYSFYMGLLDKGEDRYFANTDWPRILGAIDFIRNYDGEKPLCVFLPLQYPHPPYSVEEPWYSATDRASVPERIPEPSDLELRPHMMRGLLDRMNLRGWSEERWAELRATYYGACARVDYQFGLVLDAFREKGLLDDTGVFFFSDHGDFTGDYGLVEKAQNLFYDCLVNVPFIVRPPKGQPIRPRVSQAQVELIDFYATVLDLVGIESPHWHFGRSLLPVIAGETDSHRDAVFCEGGRLPHEKQASEYQSSAHLKPTGTYWPRISLQQEEEPLAHAKAAMVRTETYKYIQRLGETDELYDLKNDPREERNLIQDPAYAGVLAELRQRMLRWYMETADVVPYAFDRR